MAPYLPQIEGKMHVPAGNLFSRARFLFAVVALELALQWHCAVSMVSLLEWELKDWNSCVDKAKFQLVKANLWDWIVLILTLNSRYNVVRFYKKQATISLPVRGYCIYIICGCSLCSVCACICELGYFLPDLCSQSVPAALGRLQVGWVCGKPQGEVSGCMLHAPLYSVRVTCQPLVWPAINKPQWKLKI